MRNIPAPILSHLAGEVLTLAICVKITRTDSVVFGFTTHDQNLVVSGVTYEALSSITATALRQELGSGVDNLDVMGMLQSDQIDETDLLAGRFDLASIEIALVNWSSPSSGKIVLLSGVLGEVTIRDGQFTAEVRSLSQRLQQEIGEVTSSTCRVKKLGDARCGIDVVNDYTVSGHKIQLPYSVSVVQTPRAMILSGIVTVAGFYTYGTLYMTSGQNAGLSREIKIHSNSDTADQVTLASSPSSMSVGYDPNNCGTAFSFTIPAGSWTSAILTINQTWTQIDSDVGTDILKVQLPLGSEFLVREASGPSTYQNSFSLGPSAMSFLQTLAGTLSPLSGCFKHDSADHTNGPFHNISVNSCQLVLTGTSSATSSRIVLQEAFPFPVSVGDSGIIEAGCDRLSSTCKGKFNNIVNFRGEIFVPGTDKLIQRGRPGEG